MSNVGLYAVLMQEQQGNVHPVGFPNEVLTSAEKVAQLPIGMLLIAWVLTI